jgi:hypothetical protein
MAISRSPHYDYANMIGISPMEQYADEQRRHMQDQMMAMKMAFAPGALGASLAASPRPAPSKSEENPVLLLL